MILCDYNTYDYFLFYIIKTYIVILYYLYKYLYTPIHPTTLIYLYIPIHPIALIYTLLLFTMDTMRTLIFSIVIYQFLNNK